MGGWRKGLRQLQKTAWKVGAAGSPPPQPGVSTRLQPCFPTSFVLDQDLLSFSLHLVSFKP